MDNEGNARKRQRRNAIRPNSQEAMAIREIANDYASRTAVEVVENLHIAGEQDDEVIIAQMHPMSPFSTSPAASAVAAPVGSSVPPRALTALAFPVDSASYYSPTVTATIVNIFPCVEEDAVLFSDGVSRSDSTSHLVPNDEGGIAMVTAVCIDEDDAGEPSVSLNDIQIGEVVSDGEELESTAQLEVEEGSSLSVPLQPESREHNSERCDIARGQ